MTRSFDFKPFSISKVKKSQNPLTNYPDEKDRFDAEAEISAGLIAFDTDGTRLTTGFGGADGLALIVSTHGAFSGSALAVADDIAYIAGKAGSLPAVAACTAQGQPVAGFGSGGLAVVDRTTSTVQWSIAVSQDRIYLMGARYQGDNSANPLTDSVFALDRTSGALVGSFAGDGMLTPVARISAGVVLEDGVLIMAGARSDGRAFLQAVTSAGQPLHGFGIGGVSDLPYLDTADIAAATRQNGRVILGGALAGDLLAAGLVVAVRSGERTVTLDNLPGSTWVQVDTGGIGQAVGGRTIFSGLPSSTPHAFQPGPAPSGPG